MSAAGDLSYQDEQQARWTAWKARNAASDRVTHRRVRIGFTVAVVVYLCVMVALLW